MNQKFFLLCLILIFLPACTQSDESLLQPRENITVHVMQVIGESIFIDTNGLDVLIDVGGGKRGGPQVVDYLKGMNQTNIDIVIASHHHGDHIKGLGAVLDSINVTTILDNGVENADYFNLSKKNYQYYISLAKRKDFIIAERGQTYNLDNFTTLTILNPVQPLEFDDENDNSIVAKLTYGDVSFIFTGDCGKPCEESILKSGESIFKSGFDLSTDFLKIGHHGNIDSTGLIFLTTVNPKVAIINDGKSKNPKRPHPKVLDSLSRKNIAIYRTRIHDNIIIKTNGKEYWITTSK